MPDFPGRDLGRFPQQKAVSSNFFFSAMNLAAAQSNLLDPVYNNGASVEKNAQAIR